MNQQHSCEVREQLSGNFGQLVATLTPHTAPDEQGRQQFTADWVNADGKRRGQVFRTQIETTAESFRRSGYAVHIAPVTP